MTKAGHRKLNEPITWDDWFATMTDEQVKRLWRGAYSRVIINESFGTGDVIELDAAGEELAKRGFRIVDGVPEIVEVEQE